MIIVKRIPLESDLNVFDETKILNQVKEELPSEHNPKNLDLRIESQTITNDYLYLSISLKKKATLSRGKRNRRD